MSNGCPFRNKECFGCGKKGHLKWKCHKSEGDEKKESKTGIHKLGGAQAEADIRVSEDDSGGLGELGGLDLLDLYKLGAQSKHEPVFVELSLNGHVARMEVDTGAAVSVMSSGMYERINGGGKGDGLKESKLRLRTYTGETIVPDGVGKVDVMYESQRCKLPVTVVGGNVPTLLGRDLLACLKLDWGKLFLTPSVNLVKSDDQVDQLIAEFPEVFSDKLGCLKDFKAHIPIPEGTKPKFCKARSVAYALRDRFDEALNQAVDQGLWKAVKYSRWAAPVVPVMKDPKNPEGPLRLCGDYKMTVNQVAPLDSYPIPVTQDQLATLAGGSKFTKLDLAQAYQQLELDDESREYLTINTPKGLFQPARLQFGVHSATGMFQR